jgi:probable HAF family extracellular repeat protein
MGDLPGGDFSSIALGLGIGKTPVACGWSESSLEREAFCWTPRGGIVGLGTLSGGYNSEAVAVSADGRVVVGTSTTWPPYEQAFRWTAEEGMVGLGFVPPGEYSSVARAVNADGTVIVGMSGAEAFRWTAETGMVGLGDLPGGYVSSSAYAVSADGSVVVGAGQTDDGYAAFRWTEGDGMVALFEPPDPPGGTPEARATAVSAAGDVIVGQYLVEPPYTFQGFRWTAETGMVSLDDLGGGGPHFNKVHGISADGQTIIGEGLGADWALIWTEEGGTARLMDVLEDTYGLSLAGWSLYSARAISADGRTIVGEGSGPGGEQAWIAELGSCPGDLNGDGLRNFEDFTTFSGAYGTATGDPYYNPEADFDANGLINFADFTTFSGYYGVPCP